MIQDNTPDFHRQQAELARQYRLQPRNNSMNATENIAAGAGPVSAGALDALQIAAAIKAGGQFTDLPTLDAAAAMLCQQAAELEAVGAGGVQALSAAPVRACVCGEPQASGTVHRVDGPCYVAALQQEAHHLTQALTDPENQPNQYGVEFGMSGQQMHFRIGNQLFRLAYEPDDQKEFEFMKRMLINAFSTFTPDVKTAPQQGAQEPVAYVHVPHCTVEGEVRPVVSFEKYQQDYADGIYSTRIPLYTAPPPAPAPLSAREIELLDGMIDAQLNHAQRCDSIPNRPMAEKQKGWDMERVTLLRKLKTAMGGPQQ